MDDKRAEIKAERLFDTLFYSYSRGIEKWKIKDQSEALGFVADAQSAGASVWYAGRAICVFQPPVELPRRLKR